jgi:hypothetical protein
LGVVAVGDSACHFLPILRQIIEGLLLRTEVVIVLEMVLEAVVLEAVVLEAIVLVRIIGVFIVLYVLDWLSHVLIAMLVTESSSL